MRKTKQKRLVGEIKEITENEYLDPQKVIEEAGDDEEINIRLELAKDRLIRIVIISDYVLVNEQLDVIICNYFFGKKTTWKSKKFRIFNQHVLERLTLVNKIDLLEEFLSLPHPVRSFILALNGLRNAFAHSFFPENRRREKPLYKKKSIYKIDVLREYKKDYDEAVGFLMEKAWGVKPEDTN